MNSEPAYGTTTYRPGSPGILREWHWRALALAWQDRPEGVMASESWYGDYGRISWKTWLRLKQYKVKGEAMPLIEEYQTRGEHQPHTGTTHYIQWIRLMPFSEQFYRDNWQQYHEMYPEVNAPRPEDRKEGE